MEKAATQTDDTDICLPIAREHDVQQAVTQCRRICLQCGFKQVQAIKVATALAELARNMLYHAGGGDIYIRPLHTPKPGIEIEAIDNGPGIADIALAMQDHFSTRGTLGIGLPAVKRLMDDMQIKSVPGQGTRIRARMWQ